MKGSTPPSTISAKRILVVDDAPEVAGTIQSILAQCGHQVETSTDGKSALDKFESGKYDLVITDYAMPKMNGIELAGAIKQKAAGQLVLLVSGFIFSISAKYTPPLPVDLILAKPFSLKELQEAVAGLFQAPSAAV
ncbi:MAG: FixL-related histidine kinase [Pedosphaera sp.]|nr:FixL-related histidine kinase [Pedosphaera sp.]